ncbi:MAG: hypothetical protein ACRDYF_03460 [Acidimicrobiia bacterium]
MNILKRICRLSAVVGILALAAGLATSGGRVNEICVIGGEIEYCVPREL